MKVTPIFSEADSDLRLLSWVSDRQGYVVRGKQGRTIAHRIIAERMFGFRHHKARGQKVVDHINGDKLDNRRENLRLVSRSVNALNSDYSLNAKHCRERSPGRWIAWIGKKHLGTFSSQQEAQDAASRARLELLK